MGCNGYEVCDIIHHTCLREKLTADVVRDLEKHLIRKLSALEHSLGLQHSTPESDAGCHSVPAMNPTTAWQGPLFHRPYPRQFALR